MKRLFIGILFSAIACAAISGGVRTSTQIASGSTAAPVIHIEDVDRFFAVYDAANGHPTAEQLQHDYIDPGSGGLHEFAKIRNVSGATIADALAKHPEIYAGARRCMLVLPRVRQRLDNAFNKLRELYPEIKTAPVTIVIGRTKPVGVTNSNGVYIGLESLCATDWLNPNVEDRFVHVIAHEYAHVQQVSALGDVKNPTVLLASLVEGAAEFTAELISGEVAYSESAAQIRGHEKEIETDFIADEDKTDLAKWLYNSTLEKPGDVGYWVGYRISKSYYQHAAEKRQAFRDIMEMTDPKAFLAKSGWYPGITLQ